MNKRRFSTWTIYRWVSRFERVPFLIIWGLSRILRERGTSLVVQWLRLRLPVQEVLLLSPVRKLSSCMPQSQKPKTLKKQKKKTKKPSNIIANLIKTFKMAHIKKKPLKKIFESIFGWLRYGQGGGVGSRRGGKQIFKSDQHWCFQRKIVLAPDLVFPDILGLGNQMNENVRKRRNWIQLVTAQPNLIK